MPEEEQRGAQVARRVTIADVAEARRRLEDGGVVRVQQPRPAERRHRDPDPRGRRRARLPARPGRPDAHPAPDRDDRHADARRPSSVIFTNPFFGTFSAGVAAVAEEHGYGLHFISPLHGSLSRAIAPGDGRRRRRDRPRPTTTRRSTEIRRAGLPMVTRRLGPVRRRRRRSTSTTRAAPGGRASTCSTLGHRDIARPRDRAGRARAEARGGRRRRPAAARLPDGARRGRHRARATTTIVVEPATHRRRQWPRSRGPGRPDAGRRRSSR